MLDALGLVPALTQPLRPAQHRTGLEIKRSLGDDLPPLGPDVQLVIYRVTQESLTNVVRHAQARRARSCSAARAVDVELEVADDGIGIDAAPASGGGIRGMRERAVLVGGRLTVAPAAGGGTRVRLRIPLDRA